MKRRKTDILNLEAKLENLTDQAYAIANLKTRRKYADNKNQINSNDDTKMNKNMNDLSKIIDSDKIYKFLAPNDSIGIYNYIVKKFSILREFPPFQEKVAELRVKYKILEVYQLRNTELKDVLKNRLSISRDTIDEEKLLKIEDNLIIEMANIEERLYANSEKTDRFLKSHKLEFLYNTDSNDGLKKEGLVIEKLKSILITKKEELNKVSELDTEEPLISEQLLNEIKNLEKNINKKEKVRKVNIQNEILKNERDKLSNLLSVTKYQLRICQKELDEAFRITERLILKILKIEQIEVLKEELEKITNDIKKIEIDNPELVKKKEKFEEIRIQINNIFEEIEVIEQNSVYLIEDIGASEERVIFLDYISSYELMLASGDIFFQSIENFIKNSNDSNELKFIIIAYYILFGAIKSGELEHQLKTIYVSRARNEKPLYIKSSSYDTGILYDTDMEEKIDAKVERIRSGNITESTIMSAKAICNIIENNKDIKELIDITRDKLNINLDDSFQNVGDKYEKYYNKLSNYQLYLDSRDDFLKDIYAIIDEFEFLNIESDLDYAALITYIFTNRLPVMKDLLDMFNTRLAETYTGKELLDGKIDFNTVYLKVPIYTNKDYLKANVTRIVLNTQKSYEIGWSTNLPNNYYFNKYIKLLRDIYMKENKHKDKKSAIDVYVNVFNEVVKHYTYKKMMISSFKTSIDDVLALEDVVKESKIKELISECRKIDNRIIKDKKRFL